jgi:hypothetical protein
METVTVQLNVPLIISIIVLVFFTVLVVRTNKELSWKVKGKKKPEGQ